MSNNKATGGPRYLRAAAVAAEMEGLPALAEICGRLSVVPPSTWAALKAADPEGFAELAQSATDGAAYLRDLAAVLDEAASNLKAATS